MFISIMRIVICIISVHDDVDVSAYEYIHGCVDVCVNDNVYVYRYLYMHEPQNEN